VAAGGGGSATYLRAHVNRTGLTGSDNNDVISLQFDSGGDAPDSTSTSGWTIDVRNTLDAANDWYRLDLSSTTGAIDGYYLDFTQGGTVTDVQATQDIRVSYDSGTGNVTGLDSFTNTITLDSAGYNLSTTDIPTDLVAVWGMNETGSTADRVNLWNSGTHDLTPSNTPSSITGKLGNATDFDDASTEYLSVAHHADFATSATEHFMISVWANKDSGATDGTIISKYDPSGDQNWWFHVQSSSTYRWRITRSSGSTSVLTFGSVSTGWAHFFLGFDPDGVDTPGENEGWARENNGTEGYVDMFAQDIMTAETPSIGVGAYGIDGTPAMALAGAVDQTMYWGGYTTKKSEVTLTSIYNGGNGNPFPFTPDHSGTVS